PADVKLRDQLSGNRYVGTGIQIRYNQKEEHAQIITPFRRSPAHKAGARPGDLIVRVDGKDTHKVALPKVVEWLRGEENTVVTMDVRQPGAKEKRTLKITRVVVPFDTVLGYRRGRDTDWTYRVDEKTGVGYVALRSMTSSALHELRKLEEPLRKEGIKALVIDLRFAYGEPAEYAARTAD